MAATSKTGSSGAGDPLTDLTDAVEVLGDDIELLSLLTEGGFEDTERQFDKANARFDTVEVNVNKVNVALNDAAEKIDGLISALWGAGGLVGLGIAIAAFFLTHGSHASPQAAVPVTPAPQLSVYLGTGLVAESTQAHSTCTQPESWTLAASGEAGEKLPPERYIPKGPLTGQKKPPCDARQSQQEVSGGCWMRIYRDPPCDLLYRNGDACYAPVAADPKVPVGTEAITCESKSR